MPSYSHDRSDITNAYMLKLHLFEKQESIKYLRPFNRKNHMLLEVCLSEFVELFGFRSS